MVSTTLPSASMPSTRHESTAFPSSITVQHPQSPESHPLLVPVSPRRSRITARSVSFGSTLTFNCLPFRVRWIACFAIGRWSPLQKESDRIRCCPGFLYRAAGKDANHGSSVFGGTSDIGYGAAISGGHLRCCLDQGVVRSLILQHCLGPSGSDRRWSDASE